MLGIAVVCDNGPVYGPFMDLLEAVAWAQERGLEFWYLDNAAAYENIIVEPHDRFPTE